MKKMLSFYPTFDKQDKLLYGSGRNWNLARLGKYFKIERKRGQGNNDDIW
jgi:hypothetical protein